MSYTNKELAAQCLIEAAGLLNESGGARQRYIRQLADKQDDLKKRITREEKLVSHGKSPETLEKLREEYDEVKEKAREYSHRIYNNTHEHSDERFYIDNNYMSYEPESIEQHHMEDEWQNMSKAARDKRVMHSKMDRTDTYLDTGCSYKFKNLIDNKNYENVTKKRNKDLHKKINDRAKNLKNESVGISSLLREAADLLED